LLGGVLSGAPIVRLVATHGHTDHVGLAGWLHDRAGGVPYHIALAEWLSAQVRIDEARSPLAKSSVRFLLAHGCDEETVAGFADDRRRTHAYMQPLPQAISRLRDGMHITLGHRQWQVMLCGGHAAEQASFWCEAERILIAGDQILSKISPMIGVFPGEPEANPLAEYLDSLGRFRALGPDIFVLPSHGLPFYGLTERADELAQHHELRLTELADLMRMPRSTMELARGLFPRAVADGHARHAFAETLAHAHFLLGAGRAERRTGPGGVHLFSSSR
jgi:glyoxylase-like metal-dependent hydrolase (beta-lactamase superfamily II)